MIAGTAMAMEPISAFAMADKIMKIVTQMFLVARTRAKGKSEDRRKAAALLDKIEKEVLSVAKQMNRKIIPDNTCAAIFAYSEQVPPILSTVYSDEVATKIGVELADVFEARRLARAILDSNAGNSKAELKALTSSIEAAAGIIKATANVLRAM